MSSCRSWRAWRAGSLAPVLWLAWIAGAAGGEPAPPVGACCSPTGTCIVTTQEICEAGGREYLGDDTDCDPNPCNTPIGACCFPDTTCQILPMADCAAAGGIFQGDGAACEPSPCVPIGACCLFGGLCSIAVESDCVDGDGEYLGDGTTCELSPCSPTGAGLSTEVPQRIRLSAPYPNPTAGAVRFRVELPSAEWVSVRVTDVTGRVVREPVRDRLPRGIHVVTWDPSGGPRVSAGIYFLHLEAGGARETRKVVVTD